MARRHADDYVFWATLGIILGGRIGYVLFYHIDMLARPLDVLKLWEGGMAFHGGAIGVLLATAWMCRREGLSFLRFIDYIVCCVPFGLLFGRLANFVNGELWGKVTDVPWAIVFPTGGPEPRHPSQLYEAVLEGPLLFAILCWAFWRTQARYEPGRLLGIATFGYGVIRFGLEFVRQPDAQFEGTFLYTTIHMGQLLSLPMIVAGLWLILTAKGRRVRVEPTAGTASVG